jgi:fatty acid desaturase
MPINTYSPEIRQAHMSAEQQIPRKRGTSMYGELLDEVRAAGLLQPQTAYYISRITINTAALSGAWALFFLLGNSWLQLVTAGFLGFMFAQCAMIGHDAAHRLVSRSRVVNSALGYVHFDLLIGMSFGYWAERHRRHHTYPNDPERDPEVNNEFIAFTVAQMHARSGLRRRLSRCQAILFFPGIFLLQPYAMRVTHSRQLLRSRNRGRVAESCLLAMHAALYITAVFLVLSPTLAVVFVIAQQGLFSAYLGGIIAPNHKGMEIQYNSTGTGFLKRQLHSSRNIRGGLLTEILFGGLNYQIEHHLFPSMPTPCLRRAKPIVRDYCERHNLMYVETSIFGSYRTLLAYLHTVGRSSASETLAPEIDLARN